MGEQQQQPSAGLRAGAGRWTSRTSVSDGLMGSSQGVLRGCGHQHLTAVFNFIGFWVFGVLLGYLLCFKAHLGIFGLWTGIASGDSATAVLNLVAISRIKWRKEADQAVHRLQALAKQAEELQALVKEASVRGGRAHAAGDTAAAAAATAAAALAAADGDGLAAHPASVGGGGRSYAGGLKRVWSERGVQQTVAEERERRRRQEREEEAGQPKGLVAKMVRNLSSSFRNASASIFRRPDSRQRRQELPLGELDER